MNNTLLTTGLGEPSGSDRYVSTILSNRAIFDHSLISDCCSKVIMSGINGNVIMSGCGDDHSDDERREAARDNTKSDSRRADSGGGRDGDRSQRAAVLPDQSWGNQASGEGSGAWESWSSV